MGKFFTWLGTPEEWLLLAVIAALAGLVYFLYGVGLATQRGLAYLATVGTRQRTPLV